ncbi:MULTISPECIES: HIT family protein [Vibrio oreintalis group]|uniref:HIT family hydrolase n=1 Tax=Vibrio europaeus TaxID=300876 RepID=A0A178J5C7_9VIBR|nr:MULTISPECIES: hypothetical protein [Vibrio oreintalis group]MCG9583679.1 hypothetical protein [Vibrio tubiashii]MCG9617257.1 hypothetical protein [Vibrio tubiashii]MCG9689479.1 hypothetical protein [Vibrio tubiashii]MDC5706622.1 hypothetical protein [Vibrio europaeus]MDC5711845.1 hypothetical protein [Vibrio europaeus]
MTMVVFEDQHFRVSQCRTCDIPGYLIVDCKVQAVFLADLPLEAQTALGGLIGKLEIAIAKATRAEKVYCAKFGEAGGNLHFHLFPRLITITTDYLKVYPDQQHLIHGPILFDWAREYYKTVPESLSVRVRECLEEIKGLIERSQNS